MLSRFWFAMRVRRSPVLQAEARVISYGPRGAALARELAYDRPATDEQQAHHGGVARMGRRRHELLSSRDTGTKYDVVT